MLRVTVPAIGLILTVTVVLEGIAEGADGIRNVFLQGFFGTLLAVFGLLLLATFLLLSLQGEEMIRYVLDTKGIHVYTLMNHPGLLPLYARMTTPAAVETLSAATNDVTTGAWRTVRRVELPWSAVQRVRLWPETDTILLYHPTCPPPVKFPNVCYFAFRPRFFCNASQTLWSTVPFNGKPRAS